MRPTTFLKGFFTLSIFFFQSLALATSFNPRPFPDRVRETSVILRGKVTSTHADWVEDADETRRIYTFVEVQVQEIFKGDVKKKTLVFKELGGEKDGIGLEVSGTANFNVNEDVVVFLEPQDEDGTHHLSGMMLGKFEIEKNESGRESIVGPGLGRDSVSLQELRLLAGSAFPKIEKQKDTSILQNLPRPSPSVLPLQTENSLEERPKHRLRPGLWLFLFGLLVVVGLAIAVIRRRVQKSSR